MSECMFEHRWVRLERIFYARRTTLRLKNKYIVTKYMQMTPIEIAVVNYNRYKEKLANIVKVR